MKLSKLWSPLFLGLICLPTSACDISADESEEDNTNPITALPAGDSNETGTQSRFRCGVISGNSLETNIDDVRAEQVSVSPISSDIVLVTFLSGDNSGDQQLVKLHGVSSEGISSFQISKGINLITERTGSLAFYVPAGRNCDIAIAGGGTGDLGQIFTASGESISELLLAAGAVAPVIEACGAELLFACYNAIEVEEEVSNSLIRTFLWTPISELDGNVAVLVNPFNVTVRVTGSKSETLDDFGPSDGGGTTARGSEPGCTYGNGLKVEFFDPNGRRILAGDGSGSIIVPRGCDRFERDF